MYIIIIYTYLNLECAVCYIVKISMWIFSAVQKYNIEVYVQILFLHCVFFFISVICM